MRDHEFYRQRYDRLRCRGLSDADADRYIELVAELERHTESLNDALNPDFFADDLAPTYIKVSDTVAEMRRLWEKLS